MLGIGLNVAVRLEQLPAALRPGASADDRAGGLPAATLGQPEEELEPMLARLLAALERRLAQPAGATLSAWRTLDALRGRRITWAGGRGRAAGIDGAGRLIVALEDGGRTTLAAGEVHLQALA